MGKRPTGPCTADTGIESVPSADGTALLSREVLFNRGVCPTWDISVPSADGTAVLLTEVFFNRGVEMVMGLGTGVVLKMGVWIFFRCTGEEEVA